LKITSHEGIHLTWERHHIKQWEMLDDSEKSILAILYWDELTDAQQSDFSNKDYISIVKVREAQAEELANDPVRLRRKFLTDAAPLADRMVRLALGKDRNMTDLGEQATMEVWEVLKAIILTAANPTPLLDLKGKDIGDQVDTILEKVSEGKIDFSEAKEYMSLVSQGFDMQQLPDIMAKLEMLEKPSSPVRPRAVR